MPSQHDKRSRESRARILHGDQFVAARMLRDAFVLDQANLGPIPWYHGSKSAAVVLTCRDVFPGTSQSAYEAGGDLEKGALGHLLWLLERHPKLQISLFVTPDWRQISPVADRFWRRLPWVRDQLLLRGHPAGRYDGCPAPSRICLVSQCDAAHWRSLCTGCITYTGAKWSGSNFRSKIGLRALRC